VRFADKGTEDAYKGVESRAARRAVPAQIKIVALRRLQQLDQAQQLSDLAVPPGNRLEALSGTRTGQYSIRINHQYRVCFRWTNRGAEGVEITDYH